MKTKTILLTGFGPNDTVAYNGAFYCNGSTVTMEEKHADAYIKAKLANEVPDKTHESVIALQNLEVKNALRRENITRKVNGHE